MNNNSMNNSSIKNNSMPDNLLIIIIRLITEEIVSSPTDSVRVDCVCGEIESILLLIFIKQCSV